jgi:6-phosphofructokinase
LLTTPSSALGSCRHKVTGADYERILRVFKVHNAQSTKDVGRDLEAMKPFDQVIIMETLGRHAGWLPAAAALANDCDEAYLVGQTAVRQTVQGASGNMVTLVRERGAVYLCTTGLASLEAVANAEKLLPAEFINERGNGIAQAYCDYARPLLGNMPIHARLDEYSVAKRLSA